MISQQLDLSSTGKFSKLFLDYLAGKDDLAGFYKNRPDISAFEQQIQARKSFPQVKRELLADTLTEQYKTVKDVPEVVHENINRLKDGNTFTVTTGHQLNLCTGPLYVIYKLVTIIRACEELKDKYPEYQFVPVYWMASEDHDFAEIDHFNFNGHTYRWESNQQGAVGRFSLSDIRPLLQQLSAIPGMFHTAYSGKGTLADAVRHYMNALFGEYGLVVLDADNSELKRQFIDVMKADIFDHAIQPEVDETTQQLQSLGYKTQINAREINFFFVEEQMRHRIEQDGENFAVVDTDMQFTADELANLIDEKPECFSPNVVLRPLYQETILPNLAYIGGPSELVYWLQLGGVFDWAKVPFPILMPRNFAMIVPENVERKRSKTGIPIEKFFMGSEALLAETVQERSSNQLSLQEQQTKLNLLFDEISAMAQAIDPTLVANVDAQRSVGKKTLEGIEKKFLRAEKRNNETLQQQIDQVYSKLFPGNGLQERHDNFLNFYQSDPDFLKALMFHFSPFDYRFNVLSYGD